MQKQKIKATRASRSFEVEIDVRFSEIAASRWRRTKMPFDGESSIPGGSIGYG